MKIRVFSGVVMIIILFSNIISIMNVDAKEQTEFVIQKENVAYNDTKYLADIDTISIKYSMQIEGEKNLLYPTFDNRESALSNIKKSASSLLERISAENNLDELCQDNWELYYNAVAVYTDNENEIKLLKSFFDIYENDFSNEEIIQCVKQNSDAEFIREQLYYLLPNNTPYVIEVNNQISEISTYSDFDLDAAIRYAKAYAVHPNGYDYAIFDSDCTNFASQIMENAGIGQDDSLQWSNVGWWHVKDGNSHYHSKSWTVADRFARYIFVVYSKHSNYDFSENLQAGDFILEDMYDDGDWNHVGFVVQVDDYLTNGYYDYFVAQHSGNYLAWTSSDTNGWENDEAEGDKYGIIRK